jgi:hypothetical protein
MTTTLRRSSHAAQRSSPRAKSMTTSDPSESEATVSPKSDL